MSISMKVTFTPTADWLLWRIAALCFGAVGVALVSQYGFDMRPCPWCTLQRLIYILIGVLAVAGAVFPSVTVRRILAGGATMLAVLGAASALWQHFVAAPSGDTCSQSLAEKLLIDLGLMELLPEVFEPTATCAEAAVDLFGVPYALWSLGLFVLLAFGLVQITKIAK